MKKRESVISTAATMRVLNVLRHWVSKHSQVRRAQLFISLKNPPTLFSGKVSPSWFLVSQIFLLQKSLSGAKNYYFLNLQNSWSGGRCLHQGSRMLTFMHNALWARAARTSEPCQKWLLVCMMYAIDQDCINMLNVFFKYSVLKT